MPRTINRVIVGVSGSPGSLQALRCAVDLARDHAAELVPVLAWQPPGGEAQARFSPVPELAREWQHAAEHRLFTAFDEALGGLPVNLPCDLRVVRGQTGRVLISVAHEDTDLLVLGTGRRSRISRLMHTHIAPYCIAHADCCIVAVPPPPLATMSHRLHHLAI